MPETDGTRECASCGAALAGEQLICARCGEIQRRSRRVRCRQCGTLNSQSQRVCVACGDSLRGYWIRPVLATLAILIGVLLVLIAASWLHQQARTPQPVPVSTERATGQLAPTSMEMLTHSPAPSGTPLPTPITTATPTPGPTSTPSWTPTQARSPTPTSSTTPTSSSTPTATSIPTTLPSPTATPTETFTPAPSATATPFVHIVASGDTLYDIAARYDTTVQAIMEANGLTSTRLRIGQQLVIPLATATLTPSPTQP
jgi:LysM repeat protein